MPDSLIYLESSSYKHDETQLIIGINWA